MKQRALGKSGMMVSEIGLGCWQLGGDFGPVSDERAGEILAAADAAGINFWDTADVYGGGQSEERIGSYLSGRSTDVLVATKVGRSSDLFPDGYTKEKVRANLQRSASRLRTERLDLVQLHCVPPDVLLAGDLLAWLEDFRSEGLIRAFGASIETLDEGLAVIGHPALASLQVIFNLFRQDPIERLFPAAQANDVGIIVRLPLASGVLSGMMSHGQAFAPSDHRQYNRQGEAFSQGETFSGLPFEYAVDRVEEIRAWLPDGMNMAQMAMRWILDYPAVSTVIAGASRAAQVQENAAVSALPALPEELHERLADFYRTRIRDEIVVPT
jgi:aryl-alcohol dehydrogenase-like predicted oxidoreductase